MFQKEEKLELIDILVNESILNTKELHPEVIIVYILLKRFCNPYWQIDYRSFSLLSGISIKKISASIATLNNKHLISVNKSTKGKPPIIEMLDVPDRFINLRKDLLWELEIKNQIKNNNKKLMEK